MLCIGRALGRLAKASLAPGWLVLGGIALGSLVTVLLVAGSLVPVLLVLGSLVPVLPMAVLPVLGLLVPRRLVPVLLVQHLAPGLLVAGPSRCPWWCALPQRPAESLASALLLACWRWRCCWCGRWRWRWRRCQGWRWLLLLAMMLLPMGPTLLLILPCLRLERQRSPCWR